MQIQVELIQHDRRLDLAGVSDPSVFEGPMTVHFRSDVKPSITFDDAEVDALWLGDGREGIIQLDLTNGVGYHRIAFRAGTETRVFDFRTDSTKATWEQVQAMADQVARQAFSFRRQFFYSTPDGNRNTIAIPEIEFGWIRERITEISTLVADINRRPALITESKTRTSFKGNNVAVRQTVAFLREHPELLEEVPDGPIRIDDRGYWPTAVKAFVRHKRTAEIEHRQIAALLRVLAQSCARLGPQLKAPERQQVDRWARLLTSARSSPVIREHDVALASAALTPVPTQRQKIDRRYSRLRAIHFEYLREFARGDYGEPAIRTNLKDVWEIFQTFTAHMVGYALGLTYISATNDLRERDTLGRSMTSAEIDLYYDVAPPAAVLPSWRAQSDRPADERPDIVLHDRLGDRVAVIDAKFRKDRDNDRALSADLFVMQGYLQSFALKKGAIAFPSERTALISVAGAGHEIVEIPIWANPHADQLKQLLSGAVARLWQAPADRTSSATSAD